MNIISVLNGSIVKEKGIWRTTYFKEKEGFGAGDTLRVVAGYYLYKKLTSNHIETIVLVQGGYGKLAHDMIWMPPLPSAVMKNELIALGVPSECIIEESKSGNTHQQLNILLDIVHEKNPQHISIVSNAYHLPQMKTTIKHGLSGPIVLPLIFIFWAYIVSVAFLDLIRSVFYVFGSSVFYLNSPFHFLAIISLFNDMFPFFTIIHKANFFSGNKF